MSGRILRQYLEDFERAQQRYNRGARQYNASYVQEGAGAKVFEPSRPGILGVSGPGPDAPPNTFLQPFEQFSGGVNPLKPGSMVARTADSMTVRDRTELQLRPFVQETDSEGNTTYAPVGSHDMFGRPTNATMLPVDAQGNIVRANNSGANPTRLVEEDGKYFLETLDYMGQPKHSALRMYKSSQAKIDQQTARKNELVRNLQRVMNADKPRGWHEAAVNSWVAELEGMESPNLQFHGAPTFTRAQERKMLSPDNSRRLVQQAVADEPEDRGLIGRFLGA